MEGKPKIVKRLREWFKGIDDAPLWLCFCGFIFAVSASALVVSFFGPAILCGAFFGYADLIGFWAYQEWMLTHAGFLYIVVIVLTFTLAVICGIPTILYEKEKMEKEKLTAWKPDEEDVKN